MKEKFWKIYTSLCIILLIVSLIATISFGLQRIDLLDYILKISFFALLTAELIGFSWKKQFLQPWFWKVVSVSGFLLLIFNVAIKMLAAIYRVNFSEMLWFIISNFFGMFFALPLFYALYSYAFRSPEIWEKK
jgi:hypothetical protein